MKLTELFSIHPVNEAFGGLGSRLARNVAARLNPTEVGAGQRDLEAKTNALTKNWMLYRGQTNAVPNAANIEHWVKTKLGLDDPEIWAQAIDEFKEAYPKAGLKYSKEQKLDSNEIANFFNKLTQVRLMNPNTPLWTQVQKPGKASKKQDNSTAPQNTTPAAPVPQQPVAQKKNAKQQTVQVSADDEAGFPSHPVQANTAVHNTNTVNTAPAAPEAPAQKAPETPSAIPTAPAAPSTSNTENAPEENKTPGNAGNVDWEAIRQRFPAKPRISVPMGMNKVED